MVSEFERSRGIRPSGGTCKGGGGLALVMKLRVRLAALGFIFFSSCSMNYAFAKNAPYALQAKMVTEPSEIYEAAGLDFTFLNKDSQKVKSITLVFFMYDEEGNPPAIGPNNAELEIFVEVEPGEFVEDCICIDQLLYEIPDEPYQLDYLYVSRILYEDGSEWRDPYGFFSIN